MLGFNLHDWEAVMLSSLLIAGLAAVAVGISTAVVVKLQRQEAKDNAKAFAKYKVEAGLEIANAREGAANAGASAAQANERAEKARLETERIKATVSWRDLTDRQMEDLARSLSANPGKLQVQYIANDPEAFTIAMQFTTVFKAAGWEASMFSFEHPNLLLVEYFIADAQQPDTNNVRKAFNAAGIGFSIGAVPPGGWIKGDVGDKQRLMNSAILVIGSKMRPEMNKLKPKK